MQFYSKTYRASAAFSYLCRNCFYHSPISPLSPPLYSRQRLYTTAPAAIVAYPKDEAYLQTIIPKHIQLFESIQAQHLAHRQSLPVDPIKIKLPDGKEKEGRRWVTLPFDIAKEIVKSLAWNALILKVNRVLWDMNRPLEEDYELELFTFEHNEGRDTFWHSSAHILGQAIKVEYGCKLCIGPSNLLL